MGRACSTCGGEEIYMYYYDGETCGKEPLVRFRRVGRIIFKQMLKKWIRGA